MFSQKGNNTAREIWFAGGLQVEYPIQWGSSVVVRYR